MFYYFLFFIIVILIIFYYYSKKPLKGYDDLLNDYKYFKYTSGGIPKIIIKKSWQMQDNFPPILTSTLNDIIKLNPEYNLYYFDDIDSAKFMKSYSQRAYNAYNKLIPEAYKADLFRYCIIEKYGGCYTDIGHVFYTSFDDICEDCKMVLVKDMGNGGILNSLMCSYPHNPYFIKLVNECINNIENEYYGYNCLSITGPTFAGTVFYKYLLNLEYKNENLLTNANYFNKYIKRGKFDDIKFLELIINGEVETTHNDNTYIVDSNNNILLRGKFPHYYKLMYNNRNVPYYVTCWNNGIVYKSTKK